MTISPRRESGYDNRVLEQYLLGLLPSEEAERLDEATIADDQVSVRLRIVEDDLIDSYVRGTLTGETLARFESHVLSSPRRRERVAFARKLARAVDRAAMPVGAAPARRSIESRPARIMAVAAALLLAAGGALVFQTTRLSVAQRERVVLDRRARELEQQLADVRASNATTKEAEHVDQPVVAEPRPPAIALFLMPQARSMASIPTLAIPSGADGIRVELRLESNDYPRYQVGLRDPAVNTIVWHSGWIVAESSLGHSSVRVVIPVSMLKPQHYSLDVSGHRSSGISEVVGSYVFEIVPR